MQNPQAESNIHESNKFATSTVPATVDVVIIMEYDFLLLWKMTFLKFLWFIQFWIYVSILAHTNHTYTGCPQKKLYFSFYDTLLFLLDLLMLGYVRLG